MSPCSPITSARMSSLEMFSAVARYVRKRIVSRMFPIPKTRFRGKPDVFVAT